MVLGRPGAVCLGSIAGAVVWESWWGCGVWGVDWRTAVWMGRWSSEEGGKWVVAGVVVGGGNPRIHSCL